MTTATDIFAGIASSIDSEQDEDYAEYLTVRNREVPDLVAMAPSDAKSCPRAARPTGHWFLCPTCEARGHAKLLTDAGVEQRHDVGWKARMVAACERHEGREAARLAQEWLGRWSPQSVLTPGCRVCNGEDADYGSRPRERQCGTDCCAPIPADLLEHYNALCEE